VAGTSKSTTVVAPPILMGFAIGVEPPPSKRCPGTFTSAT